MAVSVPGLGTATAISTPVPAVRASAIVRELQRDREVGVPKQLDRRLQVVPALAGDPDLVALDARLQLGGVTLDALDDIAPQLIREALSQTRLLAYPPLLPPLPLPPLYPLDHNLPLTPPPP